MIKLRLSLLLILVATLHITAQKNTEPNANEINLAQTIKESHPDDKVAIESEEYMVSFDYDKKNQKVSVLEKINTNF